MYYKNGDMLFEFLYDFLDFKEFKTILPDFFSKVFKNALDMLLDKAIPYLETKNVNREETEFFSIVITTECFFKVLESYTIDEDLNYTRLAFLLDDTNETICLNYPKVIDEMPSYKNIYSKIMNLINTKQKDVI